MAGYTEGGPSAEPRDLGEGRLGRGEVTSQPPAKEEGPSESRSLAGEIFRVLGAASTVTLSDL